MNVFPYLPNGCNVPIWFSLRKKVFKGPILGRLKRLKGCWADIIHLKNEASHRSWEGLNGVMGRYDSP